MNSFPRIAGLAALVMTTFAEPRSISTNQETIFMGRIPTQSAKKESVGTGESIIPAALSGRYNRIILSSHRYKSKRKEQGIQQQPRYSTPPPTPTVTNLNSRSYLSQVQRLEQEGRFFLAAQLAEWQQDLELAILDYEQAGWYGKAAKLAERRGDLNKANLLYKKAMGKAAEGTVLSNEARYQPENR